MQNGVCEKGEMLHDASAGGLSSDELQEMVNHVDSKRGPGKTETGKSPSSSNLKDAAGKLASRNSSGGKLKPLFPSGFLGKCPANKSMKRDGQAPSALVEFASYNQNKGISEFSKPGFRLENGASTKDKGKLHSKCNSSSPPTLFEEKVGNCLDKGTTALGESGELSNLCNGDSAAFVISDDRIRNVNPWSCNDEIQDSERASPSEKMGTDAASLLPHKTTRQHPIKMSLCTPTKCMHLHTKVPAPSHRGALHPPTGVPLLARAGAWVLPRARGSAWDLPGAWMRLISLADVQAAHEGASGLRFRRGLVLEFRIDERNNLV
ncbi:hypothetical protein Acr_20g0000060 [Actinidia rufa]|uniref:Uncharacterized protein n=1 Tax=Actinidia rufa TaxID=165716 RepID=A0A7J0GBX5_9ERIC|nr:hypothetical protein Acr_20g0000060 [Actinidia rufa]